MGGVTSDLWVRYPAGFALDVVVISTLRVAAAESRVLGLGGR